MTTLRAAAAALVAVVVLAPAASATPANVAYAITAPPTPNLLSFDPAAPGTLDAKAVTGLNGGQTLVGIDVRPQNGFLYGLGVNATANTATLYAISPQTGVAGAVGAPSQIAFTTTDGVTAVDLPDPAVVDWGFDFNPAADRIRVVAGSLNFRVDPNTGAPTDGNNNGGGTPAGTNPDGSTNTGTTTVGSAAYTNSRPNGTLTTLYTLDSTSDALYVQNTPNSGTQTLGQTLTLGGSTFDLRTPSGFDIDPAVTVTASDAAATSGTGYFTTKDTGGTWGLYSVDLPTAAVTRIGSIGDGTVAVQGLALTRSDDDGGTPLVAVDSAGTALLRFLSGSPATVEGTPAAGLAAGEKLAGVSWRPQTGQLLALGINPAADTGTLYLADPQSGALAAIGGAGQLSFETAGGSAVDLPDPATTGYGVDVNPTVDRVRIVAGNGVNARANPATGAPVDGDPGVPGDQPDGPTSPGAVAAAYTNDFGQSPAGGVTTLYDLEPTTDTLSIQNPPNDGTLTEGRALFADGSGAPVDFTTATLDIPGDVAVSTANAAAAGEALAVLAVDGTQGLYFVDLATGRSFSGGPVGGGVRELTSGLATGRRPHGPGCPCPTPTPAPGPTATPTPTPAPAPIAAAVPATEPTLKRVAKPRRMGARIDTGYVLACPAGASAGCSVTVTLKRSKTRLARAIIAVPAKATKRLKVTLTKKGRRALRRRKVRVTLTFAVTGGQTRTVKLTVRRKKV